MSDFFIGWDDEETLDLGPTLTPVEDEFDTNMQFSLLNHMTYNVSVVHELDGMYDELTTEPQMATEKAAGILWVLMTSGFFHRVYVEAVEDRQFYHIRFCEATMHYQGQLS